MSTERSSSRVPSDTQRADEASTAGDFLRELAFAPPATPLPPKRDRSGERLGRFQLTGLLGRGGMGEVYAALDLTLRRKVALKLLRAEAVGSDERQRRFVREARAAAAANHPNIATVFEVGEVSSEVFLAMELIDGRSLRALLEPTGAALPEPQATRIAHAIARGLAAAHRVGIVHRDIKPENVMVGNDGCVKVLDFGLAKVHGQPNTVNAPTASAITTRAGCVLGTPAYMAPEQARGLPTDARTDVFSLGVVLFEMLAGGRPFRGSTTVDMLAALLRDDAPALVGVSPALAGVVARCLAKEPGERYEDAGAVLAALDAATFRRAPAQAECPPPRRFPWLTLVLAVLLATPALLPYPTAITELPPPALGKPDAIKMNQSALQSFRDSNWADARSQLEKAVELDPTLAPALLRLAIVLSMHGNLLDINGSIDHANETYRKVVPLRDTLTPRDRELFDAVEPAMRPRAPQIAEAVRNLKRLTEIHPLDAELWLLLAGHQSFDAPELQRQAARHAIAIDPDYADAWLGLGLALNDKDPDGAVAAFKRCTELVPTASDCWSSLARVEIRRGRCVDAETYLNRATPDPERRLWRADVLYALGEPREAVRKALHEKQERLDPSVAPREEEAFYDRALLAAAYGDFDAAIELATEGSKRVASERPLGAHGRFALLLVDIEREAGREKKAASVASDFLRRRDAWRQPEGPMTAPDPTVYLTRVAARANLLSGADVRATRDAWYRAQTLGTPLDKARAWWLAYAMGVESEGEAREALAVRPAHAPWSNRYPWMDESMGRALWVGGQRAEALPYLERAFKSCDQLEVVLSAMRTNLRYGQALEAEGDRERACEVYGTITQRWGEAKPRSVTAEEARRRAEGLGCDVALRPGESLEQG